MFEWVKECGFVRVKKKWRCWRDKEKPQRLLNEQLPTRVAEFA